MGDEGHHRKVGDGRVDRLAGAQGPETAERDADLLLGLALGRLPGGLAGPDPAAGERDLARMVRQVGPPPDERNLPRPVYVIEDEGDGGPASSPAELAPPVDRAEQAFDLVQEVAQKVLWTAAQAAGKLENV